MSGFRPAEGRPGGRILPKSGPETRFPARSHYVLRNIEYVHLYMSLRQVTIAHAVRNIGYVHLYMSLRQVTIAQRSETRGSGGRRVDRGARSTQSYCLRNKNARRNPVNL